MMYAVTSRTPASVTLSGRSSGMIDERSVDRFAIWAFATVTGSGSAAVFSTTL